MKNPKYPAILTACLTLSSLGISSLTSPSAAIPAKSQNSSGLLIAAATSSDASDAKESRDAKDSGANPAPLQSSALSAAISAYKSSPNAVTWQAVWKMTRDVVGSPSAAHIPAASILKANPELSELGIKAVDAEFGARIWAFPKITECGAVFAQYQVSSGPGTKRVIGKGRHRKVVVEPAPLVTKSQVLNIPAGVVFRDAQFIRSAAKATKFEGRDLVLVGNERQGGTMWIGAYKLAEGGLFEDSAALSTIPPYLVQNVAGNPGFSGNNLILSLGGGSGGPQSSGYKIVLHFVDGKFCMEGQGSGQDPAMAVFQFVQAIQQNRLDVARAWLADPKLIAIPKYIGLLNGNPEKPFRVIAMSSPLLTGSRFRIMTSEKNDLIADVGKVKTQWMIKALYIAPPDPLAQKIGGFVANPAPAAPAAGASDSGSPKPTSAK